ncbi:dual specificity protein phosphatase family protein [Entomomonas asaccharolytica]|uniref:diphosphoinositol-polyphosphate diphosphatase n=1 Tax=Entomomonas asaccharolytica TaxID=2785331 RepID=A0A974RVT4_9GAMM|nr:dual specificity protein phosphatase family protein [Entomomonas asaccharolytica]QQP84382.1 dual specificity protein phosphatase family protein [Entomomonas asaccharolytica]
MKITHYYHLAWFIFICLISNLAMAMQNNEEWADPIDPSFNFYQVSPLLYRSALPDTSKVETIKKQNIATIITLIKEDDTKWLGKNEKIQLVKYPTHADRVKDDDVLKVLKLIQQSQSEGKAVLLHCKHGQNRTGLFIAMYRIVVQRWSKEQAINELVYGISSTEMEDVNEAMAYIQKANVNGIRKALKNNDCSTSRWAVCNFFSS